jgi:hypothetical protein
MMKRNLLCDYDRDYEIVVLICCGRCIIIQKGLSRPLAASVHPMQTIALRSSVEGKGRLLTVLFCPDPICLVRNG